MARTKNPPLFHFPEKYHERLEQIGQLVGGILWRNGTKEQDAQRIAFEITEGLRRDFGGAQFYLTKSDWFELTPRDNEIWKKFNGRNYFELAQEYDLSEVHIRNIVNAARDRDVASRQGKLPGL